MSNTWRDVVSPTISTSLIAGTSSFDLLNTTATTVNAFGAATTATLGYNSTGGSTTNISTGVVASGNTKLINIGTGGVAGSSTTITLGSANGTNVNIGGNATIGGTFFANSSAYFDGGVIELGRRDGVASTPYIDFHSGSTTTDYDSRIIADSGNGSSGNGTLTYHAGNGHNFVGGIIGSAGMASNSATSGIGYTTGAGGTVTQTTNKSTNVTINKICGKITMNNASLAGGASAYFAVSNSTFGENDIPMVCTGAGFSTSYKASIVGVQQGSFFIEVTNIGTTQSEAVTINFAIIKSVNS